VLLISIDTLRADRLNSYGYEGRRVSPRIDALARDGVLFEAHTSSAPWTKPAHMSLFTSLRPTAHGVTQLPRQGRDALGDGTLPTLAPDVPTLPEILQGQGWPTAAFTGGVSLDPRIGFGRGFDLYDTAQFKLRKKSMAPLFAWLEAHQRGPFLLFWHTFEVHAPYLSGDFLPEVLPPESAATLDRALRRYRRQVPAHGAGTVERILEDHGAFTPEVTYALYDGGVLSMDRWVGRVLDHLEELDLYDRTLIVLTSDHGEQLGERDGRFYNVHGDTLYEEMVRVPLIVKLPGQEAAGTRVAVTTRGIDVMPTILDLADISTDGLDIQGTSLRPLWQDPGTAEARPAVSESVTEPFELKSIRWGPMKYIVRTSPEDVARHGRAHIPSVPEKRQLFDLRRDPGELVNLLEARETAPEVSGTASRLADELRSRVSEKQGHPVTTQADQEMLDALRALGYIDGSATEPER
jgi:arylsulfatase A-like enzyme